VIGTLSISLPANLLISGAAEITVNNVKLAVEISPSVTPDDTSDSTTSPPSTPRPGDRPSQSSLRHGAFSDGPESPATAEDLAESFLQSQSQTEKQQLMSLYAEAPMTSSVLSSTTATSESEEEEELGVGTAIGLPSVLANIFKGIADKMVVQVRRVNAALEITLPEDRGGEKVLLEFEVEEVEVEGVSKNVPFTIVDDGREKPRREGKRRITLENICGFVTSVDSMFGMEDSHMEQSTIFGEHSEIPTEMRAGNGGNGSVAEEHGEEASHEKPTALIFLDASRLESVQPTYDQPQAPLCPSAQNNSLVDKGEDGAEIERNNSSEGERFTDFEDSDEEVLAFAPPSMHSSSSRSPHVRHSQVLREAHFVHDIDSEDDGGGGGAAFAPLMRRSLVESVISTRSPPICSPNSTPRDSDPFLQSSAIQCAVPQSVTDHDGSEDEMDQEASRMLSQSTIFSREEADSLYLSATSGMLHSKSELRMSRRHQRPIEEAHEIDSQEIEQRLDKLINGESSLPTKDTLPPLDDFHRSESLKSHRTHRKIRKKCLELDVITIYYPSLSAGITAVVQESPPPSPQRKACSPKHNMPGTFSMYASKHIQKSPPPPRHATSSSPPTQHRTPPRVKIVDSVDARPAAPVLDRIRGDKNADIEIVASSIRGTVDIHTEKMLACAVEVIQNVLHEEASLGSPKPTKITPHKKPDEQQKTVQIVAEKIDLRMVKHLGGFFDDQHEDIGDETIQLQCLLKDVKVFRKGLPDEASTSKLSVKKFALNDEEEGIITFLPSASPSSSSAKIPTSQHRRRSSTNSAVIEHDPSDDDDITVIFSRGVSKVRVNVVTLPLKIRGDLKRLEETFSAFGGVGSVLASTTASTATIRNSGRPPLWQKHDSGMPVPRGVDIKVDCRIGGIFFDVVGTSAQVNLETSPVKIKFQSGSGVTVGIDKMKISAPSPDRKDLYVVINESTIQFASRPTQEDLGRLLELLTPSKDKFDDDDILIDTLLRQREQGSVLRVHLTGVRGELLDMAIFDKLKGLGDEVIQVLTVTDFVAGDERPGLLTLVNVDVIYSYADFGGGMGRMEVEMASVGLTHVSTPSLLAMAIGTIGVRRNDHEVLLGEGLDRRIFSTSELDRPMIMVRMVGDEPEPVVKIKLWNVRVEYSVQTLMELLESPEGATGEELAQEMVNSIVRLPPQMKPLPADTGALGFDIAIKDSAVALNPLDLKSRGLIIFTDARLQAALPVGGTISAGMEVKKASVMIIDHVDHLISVDPGHIHSRKNALSGHLTGFASMGYVPVVTISSAMASLRVVDRAVDLDIKDDLLLIESCADSTQTLIAILNGLKPPAAEAEEIRYCTEVLPINMLQSLTEDAFTNPSHELGDGFAIDDDGVMLEVELGENLPTMSTFVESFYGHRGDPALGSPEEDLADSLLEEDLSSIRTPTLSRQGSGNDSIFMENIAILDSEPTKFIEDHFGKTDCKRRGKKSLNQRAVEAYVISHFLFIS
jgi:autophagy-related protein 2